MLILIYNCKIIYDEKLKNIYCFTLNCPFNHKLNIQKECFREV